MRRCDRAIVGIAALLALATTLQAQPAPSSSEPSVPSLVRFASTFVPANGLAPAPVETVTLAIYQEESGGAPLWQETQYVTVDAAGRYSVLLGATLPNGLPVDLFASGEARWLGRRFERPGEPEQARVLLASVPYALKASDADTLGGLPPSAYLLADPATSSRATDTLQTAAAPNPQALTSGTAGCVAEFTDTTDLGCSPMVDVGGSIGLGTATPFDRFHVRFTNTNGGFTGLAVQNLGGTASSYSGMLFYDQNGALGQFQGFNNATHEYRINNIASGGSINFMLGSSSRFQVRADGDIEVQGRVRSGGNLFIHRTGLGNTFVGLTAGSVLTTGAYNTATGLNAMASQTNGNNNTAMGAYALAANTTAWNNTALGIEVLRLNSSGGGNTGTGAFAFDANTTGSNGTANGTFALESNTSGIRNTATGFAALWNNTVGSQNVALGYFAGGNATDGSNNIYLGANVTGVAGEANAIYLGVQGTQTKTVVAGIRGITTGVADAIPVMIDSAGQLGTVSSSRRFKEDIHDMGDASRALFALRPVTFRYSRAYSNGTTPIQYGLVAEEVAEAFPDLAVRNAEGGVDTVHYETLSVLLLNELQKQRIDMQAQQRRIEALERQLEALAKAE